MITSVKVGNIIKEYRLEKELSQKELADLVSVSKNSISSWETDKYQPTITNLIKLTDYLGLDFILELFYSNGIDIYKRRLQ